MKRIGILLSVLLIAACSSGSSTDDGFADEAAYQLTTKFTGETKPLGINVDADDQSSALLIMSEQAASTRWTLTEASPGVYRLAPASPYSNLSLDVENIGDAYKPVLTQGSPNDSQLWQITSLDNGYCRITSFLLGTGLSLDIVNDDNDDQLKLSESGNYTGQQWQLRAVQEGIADTNLNECVANTQTSESPKPIIATSDYRKTTMAGFNILVNPNIDAAGQIGQDALAELEKQLDTIATVIPSDALAQIRQTTIWLEANQLDNRSGQYHVSREWLSNNGYNPDKAGGVEISNAEIFISDANNLNVSTTLHELAHARQFFLIDNNSTLDFTQAYEAAVASGIYESVEYATGTLREAYALTNEKEYFAELSEAYFGNNDFYPFNRSQLMTFDKLGYDLIKAAWENQ